MSLAGCRDAELLDAELQDCSDAPASSAASEDVVDIAEAEPSVPRLQAAVRVLLHGVGETLEREGLRDTPKRVAKAWIEASEGYRQSVHGVLGGALFHEPGSSGREDGMVIVRDVEFASTSEHSLLPFFGRCHIAYVPRNGVVLGLSKVARLTRLLARRLQSQQRFTDTLLEAFQAEVQPFGCAAVVRAQHLGGDGRRRQQRVCTAAALGCFLEQPDAFMQEFLCLLGPEGRPEPAAQQLRQQLPGSPGSPADASPRAVAAFPSSSGGSAASSPGSQGEAAMAAAVETILREVGEDPSRKGLAGSAARYVQHLLASTSGRADAEACGIPHAPCEAASPGWPDAPPVELRLAFNSQCEHHLLPFQGTLQVISLPARGRPPLPRGAAAAALQAVSRRLQLQERLTAQLADALQAWDGGSARGTLVLCCARHMCMVARGIEARASRTVTVAARGLLLSDAALRARALGRLQAAAADC